VFAEPIVNALVIEESATMGIDMDTFVIGPQCARLELC
jgi:hypothetical protein